MRGRFIAWSLAGLAIMGMVVMMAALASPRIDAQRAAVSDKPDVPFKLATFEAQGRVRVGMVLGERILDLAGANALVEKQASLPSVRIPGEMRELIEQSDTVSRRLYQIANYSKEASFEKQPFLYQVDRVSIKAPIKYPWNLIAAAANYKSHAAEMAVNAAPDPDRDDPYMFAKSPRSCIVDPGTPFVIPAGRDKIDWEGELAVVIGKPAFNVSRARAMDYVFGYTIMYDVSDRGGGTRAKPTFSVDWFSGKSRDGAAPMGPYLVPKEFMPDVTNLRIVTRVNERVVQDGNTSDMIYDIPRLIAYNTSILTLYPGDMIATGTPDGVGAARKPPEFVKPGDVVSVEIQGIGVLKTPMKAAASTN